MRFEKVYCSQCGGAFGPRDSGYSHCRDHRSKRPLDTDFGGVWKDMRDAMSMCALLLNFAKWQKRSDGSYWYLSAIYHDGTVRATQDGKSGAMRVRPSNFLELFDRVQ